MCRSFTLVAGLALVLALAGCAAGTDVAVGDGHAHGGENAPVADGAREIAVRAENLRFAPDRIEVAAGEDIALAFTSADIGHDFTIEELDVHVGAEAGKTERGGLRVDEPGTYTFVCSVPGHEAAGMRGTLVVTEP